MQETQLGRTPREGNGNPSSIPAWEIPWTEGPGGLQSEECRHDLAIKQRQLYVTGRHLRIQNECSQLHQFSCAELTNQACRNWAIHRLLMNQENKDTSQYM